MNLPLLPYAVKAELREQHGQRQVKCAVRKKWLVAQPEEMVRQGLINYLLAQGYPLTLMQVERGVPNSHDRLDLLVLGRDTKPFLLAEVKAPGYDLQPAIDQLARYNRQWQAPFALACNGEEAICCQLYYAEQRMELLDSLPSYIVDNSKNGKGKNA